MVQTYIIIDFYTEKFERLEVDHKDEVEEYISNFVSELLDNCDISETCELDITVIGPIESRKPRNKKGPPVVNADVHQIYIHEIPPREPSYEIEWCK